MNFKNIANGDTFKNWKEFCKAVDIKYKTSGNSRKGDERKLSSLCEWHKEGQKVIIDNIYDKPKEIKETRGGANNHNNKYGSILTEKERKRIFDGYYVYAHIKNGEYVYIGKGSKDRAIKSMYQRFNKDEYDKVEIKILKRFGNDEQGALEYEDKMIKYYKSIGQCILNNEIYHIGSLSSKEMKIQKLTKEYNNLINKKETFIQAIDDIDLQIKNINDELTKLIER